MTLARWRILVLSLAAATLILPGVQWGITSASWWQSSHYDLPNGQSLYLLSKLLALYAIALFAIQLSYGLLGRARTSLDLDWGVRFHGGLGLTVLACSVSHSLAFVAGATLRTGHFASQYLWPQWDQGFYPARISLGWCAVIGLIGVAAAGWRRLSTRGPWQVVHWLSLPVGLLVALHSLAIGTESRMPWMQLAYVSMAGLLLAAVYLRRKPAIPTSLVPQFTV